MAPPAYWHPSTAEWLREHDPETYARWEPALEVLAGPPRATSFKRRRCFP